MCFHDVGNAGSNGKSVKMLKYRAEALARKAAEGGSNDTSSADNRPPMSNTVVERNDSKVTSEDGIKRGSDTTAFVDATTRSIASKTLDIGKISHAEDVKDAAVEKSTASSAAESKGKASTLVQAMPTSANISRLPNPSEEDKLIWKEIFGREFDPQNIGEEFNVQDSVSSRRDYLSVWEALDELFSDDSKHAIQIDSINSFSADLSNSNNGFEASDNHLTSASQLSVSLSFLRRGLQSAEVMLGVPNLLADIHALAAKYNTARSRLISCVRPSSCCPGLSNSLWTALGVIIVDAIVSVNNIFGVDLLESLAVQSSSSQTRTCGDKEQWSQNVCSALCKLSSDMKISEVDVLRSYFA
jgi:hypothetical protein